MKRLLLLTVSFLFACSLVDAAFGNPIPWDPADFFFHLDPIQYLSIITAQFCALTVGTATLTHLHQPQWKKAAPTMLAAITASYLLGITTWILAAKTGILTYDYSNPTTLAALTLPEILGTLLGTIIIRKLQKTKWQTALIIMTAAMITSLTISIILATITHLA